MTLAILIPAAGNSSRLGQPKQLVRLQAQPLLSRQIGLCFDVCQRVYCVLGAHAELITGQIAEQIAGQIAEQIAEQVAEQANHQPCCFLHNPHWQQGLGHSIAFAVNRLPEDISALMIVLADQWALNQQDLNRLIHSWQNRPTHIHAASYLQQTAVPAIFPTAYFSELARLSGKQGAKPLLTRYQHQVVAVPMANAATDLDTPEQLIELLRSDQDRRHSDPC